MVKHANFLKKNYFSLLEVMIALGIIVLLVTAALSSIPALESYRFNKNQKKICEIMRFCYTTAKINHQDVLINLKNDHQNLLINISSDEKGEIFFKSKKRSFVLKNFFLRDRESFMIRFSQTGWIFPLNSKLSFVNSKKRIFTLDVEKLFGMTRVEKDNKENLYLPKKHL